MLFISHDRYFIKEVADALLIFGENGVSYYPFGYGHYVEHLRKKQEYGWAGAEAVAVENTRLIEGLKEVPEKTRMQSARFSTEQSYTDWQLTLAGEQLAKAAAAVEHFLGEQLPFGEELSKHDTSMEILTARIQARRRWQEEYETLEQQYTEACLFWYCLLYTSDAADE